MLRFDYKKYRNEHDPWVESWRYMYLDGEQMGLPLNMYVDCGQAYRLDNHPLWLYLTWRDNESEIKDCVPVSISENPCVMTSEPDFPLPKTLWDEVVRFIRINRKNLSDLADYIIHSYPFMLRMRECLKEDRPSIHLENASYPLYDMELAEYLYLSPEQTGLGVDVFIDDREGCAERLHPLWMYFRNNYTHAYNFLPVSVEENPKLMLEDVRLDIVSADMNLVIEFVKLNRKILEDLAVGNIQNVDVLKLVKRVRKSETRITKTSGFGDFYTVESEGRKGVLDKKGRMIVPCEMDEIYGMQDEDGIISFLKDGKWGLLDGNTADYVSPRFCELEIRSECAVRVRIGQEWGWVDAKGCLTNNVDKVAFGSYADKEK